MPVNYNNFDVVPQLTGEQKVYTVYISILFYLCTSECIVRMIANKEVQCTKKYTSFFWPKAGQRSNCVQVNEVICGNQLQKKRVNSG